MPCVIDVFTVVATHSLSNLRSVPQGYPNKEGILELTIWHVVKLHFLNGPSLCMQEPMNCRSVTCLQTLFLWAALFNVDVIC